MMNLMENICFTASYVIIVSNSDRARASGTQGRLPGQIRMGHQRDAIQSDACQWRKSDGSIQALSLRANLILTCISFLYRKAIV